MLGSAEQLEPLAALLVDFRTRRPAALALGHLGDPRALPLLLSLLDTEEHANIRDAVVKALGRLGEPDAIPRLTSLLVNEPDLRSTSESLVRLDAIGHGAIGGTDLGPEVDGVVGTIDCEAEDPDHPFRFAGRTRCTIASEATLPVAVPEVVSSAVDGVLLVTRLARTDGAEPVTVQIGLSGETLASLDVESEPAEHRVSLDADTLSDGAMLRIATSAPVWVDHVLLAPQSTTVAHSTFSD